jgi:hypothetical protein
MEKKQNRFSGPGITKAEFLKSISPFSLEEFLALVENGTLKTYRVKKTDKGIQIFYNFITNGKLIFIAN